jgi:small subunit ribosomal protein S12
MFPTINQLRKKKRIINKFRLYKLLALEGCPQKKGICLKLRTTKPKKPNSAIRKIVRVKLSNGKQVIAYIPGQGHNLQRFSTVLIRGGRVKDVPGLKYKLIRGKFDLTIQETIHRTCRRSKYGISKIEGMQRRDKLKNN